MFTLVCLALIAIQNLFGCAKPLLVEVGDGFVQMARRPSEALLLTNWEVPGSGAPEDLDVRGRRGCEEVPASRAAGTRRLAGQSLSTQRISFVLALGAFPNEHWRSASLWPGISGFASPPWTPASCSPVRVAAQCAVTEGKNKVNWKCQLVFCFAAELFKPLEIAYAGFIWVTIE